MRGTIQTLLDTLPQRGRVAWIGVRPERDAAMQVLDKVSAEPGTGLEGDRFSGGGSGKRQVTLIQQEHLAVISACLGGIEITPAQLRRNIVVSGINLLALKQRRFRVGSATLEWSGYCHPCSKMEKTLGPGAYNALRGHGGITARIIDAGVIGNGDEVFALFD